MTKILLPEKIILFSLFVMLGATASMAQGKTQSVTLSKARPCTILTGSVQSKNFDTYIFRATKGQTITTDPFYYGKETNRPKDDEEGSSGFVVITPGGEKYENPQDVVFNAESTGQYKVQVRPTYKRTTGKYVLKISVTNAPDNSLADLGKAPRCP